MCASFLSGDGNDRSAAPVGSLRRFTRRREQARAPVAVEHCELCREVITTEHRHLLDLAHHSLLCACQACSLLFSDEGAGAGKYRLIPQRYLLLEKFQMTDQQWDEFMLPVHMVFIFRSSGPKPVMAFYPGPAGATESLLDLQGWEVLLNDNPVLRHLEPDVEALLINRVQTVREHYIVPIDACYQLVGLLRTSWKGLSGGVEARDAINGFFADIRAKSRLVRGDQDARPEL